MHRDHRQHQLVTAILDQLDYLLVCRSLHIYTVAEEKL